MSPKPSVPAEGRQSPTAGSAGGGARSPSPPEASLSDRRIQARTHLYDVATERYPEALAVSECAALLAQEGMSTYRAALAATCLHYIGRKLLLAFERDCNTGKSAETAMRKAKDDIRLLDLPDTVSVELQSDPRGWPLIVRTSEKSVAGYAKELRVGGRS